MGMSVHGEYCYDLSFLSSHYNSLEDPEPGGVSKTLYEFLNLRALKFSPVNKICIFQCMGMIFCVEFERYPLKFHTKYLTHTLNKANLRDLIAATGLVILLKLDSNHRFFSPCDLEIWRMTFKNNRAPLLCYFKLCASFQCHRLIQTGVTVRKRLIWVKIDNFF